MQDLIALAKSFVETAKEAAKEDVERLGPYAAADYWATLASSHEYWAKLDTPEGRAALRQVAVMMSW